MRKVGKSTNILFIVMITLVISSSTIGCKSGEKVSKEVRETEKAEAQIQKEADKEYEQALKRHYKMQSRQSKQIIKDAKKQGKSANRAQQRSLWDRMFNKSCK